MLSAEDNELLTRIEPGARMGQLLRRYWHPIAGLTDLETKWTKRVRLLGEDLVLFKDRTGRLGLIAEQCPHRRASLVYGIPTEDGIRCPYHGWEMDRNGLCLDQPNEHNHGALRGKPVTTGYPVEVLGGMVWAYLGPLPAPMLPRFEGFVTEPAIRHCGRALLPCNWLQCMENSADPVHTEWLHGKTYEFMHEADNVKVAVARHHDRIAFDEYEFGIIKRRLMVGQSEESDDWKVGHPLLFPNSLAVGSGNDVWRQLTFQIRVPVDDTHTMHYWYQVFMPNEGTEVPPHLLKRVPVYDVPLKGDDGEYLMEYIDIQDVMVWATQGAIADRTRERLGGTDQGVVLLRNMLKRELAKVERGEDPLGVIRDPAKNSLIEIHFEQQKDMVSDGWPSFYKRNTGVFSPICDDLFAVFERNHGRKRSPSPAHA
jgi:5,5'-dehydrodivanillate O-demethylase